MMSKFVVVNRSSKPLEILHNAITVKLVNFVLTSTVGTAFEGGHLPVVQDVVASL